MALGNVLKNDKSGGFFIMQVSSAQDRISHRMRFHVPSFASAAGPAGAGVAPYDYGYNVKPSGREQSIAETFYELAICLRGMYSTNYLLSLAGLYRNTQATDCNYDTPGSGGGELVPCYPHPQVIPIKGTSGGNNGWLPGEVTLALPTINGGRFSARMLSSEEWDPKGSKVVVQPVGGGLLGGGSPVEITAMYLTGAPSGVSATGNGGLGEPSFGGGYTTGTNRTMLLGHDGSPLGSPVTKTNCMNKRVRRSLRLI